jgi:hypothetical protein
MAFAQREVECLHIVDQPILERPGDRGARASALSDRDGYAGDQYIRTGHKQMHPSARGGLRDRAQRPATADGSVLVTPGAVIALGWREANDQITRHEPSIVREAGATFLMHA